MSGPLGAGPPPEDLPPTPESWGAGVPGPYNDNGLRVFGHFIIFFFPASALITVMLRVYGRLFMRQFGWDDALVGIAMALSIAFTYSFYMYALSSYMAIHAVDIPPHDRMINVKWNFINMALYNPILALVKSSVLLFLLRLGGTKISIRWCIHALNGVNVALGVAAFFAVLLQCLPIESNWDNTIAPEDKTCVNGKALTVGTAVIVIVTDLLVLALPFWIFLVLKMPKRVKAALLGVFMMGLLVPIAACVRLYSILDIFRQFETGEIDPDMTYSIGPTTSLLEINISIITASLPALWPLFRQWCPGLFRKLGGTYAGGPSGGMSQQKNTSRKGAQKLVTIGGSHFTSNDDDESFAMKPMRGYGRAEIRSYTPTGSEEEIMTYDGIMRTANVDVVYEGGTLADTKSAPGHQTDRGLRTSVSQLNIDDDQVGTAR